MVNVDIIISAIERRGWQVSPVAEGWHCCRADSDHEFTMGVTSSWVCFRQPVTAWESPGLIEKRWQTLLRHNEAMFLARYGLDPAMNPVLLIELPRSGSLSLLDTTLVALARYADPTGEVFTFSGSSEPVGHITHSLLMQETPGLAQETVAYYVRAVEGRGWGLRGKPTGMTWPLGYKGHRLFDVFFSVSPAWATFQVPVWTGVPAALASPEEAVRVAFLRYLLRVNDAWYMAKLGLAASGQPILMLEVPTQELDFDLFRLCTRLIASYLDFYARELQIMAELERDHRLRAGLLAG